MIFVVLAAGCTDALDSLKKKNLSSKPDENSGGDSLVPLSISINNGATITNKSLVQVELQSTNAVSIVMAFSENDCKTFETWQEFSPLLKVELLNSNALNEIWMKGKDSEDVVGSCQMASIIHDAEKPSPPLSVFLNPDGFILNRSPSIDWIEATDNYSQLGLTYEIQIRAFIGGQILVDWTPMAKNNNVNLSGLWDSLHNYIFLVRTRDAAGNLSDSRASGRFGSSLFTNERFPHFDLPSSLSYSDLDGDGDLDIVGSASDGESILWFENQTPFGFQTHTIAIENGGDFIKVTTLDFDHDGKMDILGLEKIGGIIYFFRNTGNQEFEKIPIGSGFVNNTSMEIADLNADGYLDVATGNIVDDKIDIIFGTSDVNIYTKSANPITSDGPVQIHIADINNDQKPDLVVAGNASIGIVWYENLGLGVFGGTPTTIESGISGFTKILTLDIDGDGNLDVLTARNLSNALKLYQNSSNGSSFTNLTLLGATSGVTDISLGDINLDGKPDIVVVNNLSQEIFWLKNIGDGTFSNKNLIDNAIKGPFNIVAADFNGDQRIDIAATSLSFDSLYLYKNSYNDTNGTFSFDRVLIDRSYFPALDIKITDLDSDGDSDVITTDGSTILWHENQGGHFLTHMIDDTVNDSTLLWPIDFDKDGNMDFVTNSVTDKTLTLYQNPGNQAFSRVPLILDTNYIKTFAIGDTDNDSDYDILIGQGTNPGDIILYEQISPGAFSSHNLSSALSNPNSIAIFHGNADSYLDFAASDQNGIWVFMSNPTTPNTFSSSQLNSDSGIKDLYRWDINQDGIDDLITTNFSGSSTTIKTYLGDGNSNITASWNLIGSMAGKSILAFDDYNQSGKVDILATSNNQKNFSVYFHGSSNTFNEPDQVLMQNLYKAQCIRVADIDNDGKKEYLISAPTPSMFMILKK